jgi:hypothetical protein
VSNHGRSSLNCIAQQTKLVPNAALFIKQWSTLPYFLSRRAKIAPVKGIYRAFLGNQDVIIVFSINPGILDILGMTKPGRTVRHLLPRRDQSSILFPLKSPELVPDQSSSPSIARGWFPKARRSKGGARNVVKITVTIIAACRGLSSTPLLVP